MDYNVNTPSIRTQHADTDTDTQVKGFVKIVNASEGQPFTPKLAKPLTECTTVKGVKGSCEQFSPYRAVARESDRDLHVPLHAKSWKKPFTPFTFGKIARHLGHCGVKGWTRTPSPSLHPLHRSEVGHV